MALPNPRPAAAAWVGPCRKGSKIASPIPSGTPGPSSSTAMRIQPSDLAARSQTVVPAGVCRTLFLSRLSTMRSTFAPSRAALSGWTSIKTVWPCS